MENYQKITTTCLFILTTIAMAYVFAIGKAVLIPFTLSIFIYLVYSPLLVFLQKKLKLNRHIILITSIIALITGTLTIAALITSSVDQFIKGADQYHERLSLMTTQIVATSERIGFPVDLQELQTHIKNIPVSGFIKGITGSLLALVSNGFLVLIFTLFLLTGESVSRRKSKTIEEIKNSASKYVGTKILTSFGTAILSYIVFFIFDIEMAFMFAMLTFALNFIPNVGSIIAVALPLPVILLQLNFGFSFVLIVILLTSFQMIIGNILEPKIMGESMGLHPVTILLFLTFWGSIWGITGMFLSVPITATLKIILQKFKLTKPVANLLAGELP